MADIDFFVHPEFGAEFRSEYTREYFEDIVAQMNASPNPILVKPQLPRTFWRERIEELAFLDQCIDEKRHLLSNNQEYRPFLRKECAFFSTYGHINRNSWPQLLDTCATIGPKTEIRIHGAFQEYCCEDLGLQLGGLLQGKHYFNWRTQGRRFFADRQRMRVAESVSQTLRESRIRLGTVYSGRYADDFVPRRAPKYLLMIDEETVIHGI